MIRHVKKYAWASKEPVAKTKAWKYSWARKKACGIYSKTRWRFPGCIRQTTNQAAWTYSVTSTPSNRRSGSCCTNTVRLRIMMCTISSTKESSPEAIGRGTAGGHYSPRHCCTGTKRNKEKHNAHDNTFRCPAADCAAGHASG